MAIRLKQRGIEDFVLLERAATVGGTWTYNTYPECRCDIPSHLYSFSFAPNPDWTQTYSSQPEIRDYLGRCADEFGIRPHIRTGTGLAGGEWNEREGRWELETTAGPLSARVLVSGMGPLTEPKLPDVPGLDRFEGKLMHSARWDHDYDLAGKRVASIGTGASAIQYVPAIQPEVEKLVIFQRSAPWVLPHGNRPISDQERRLFRRLPAVQRAIRGAVYLSRELLVVGLAKERRLLRIVKHAAIAHIEKSIADPALRARVTPSYAIGCNRMVPSNRWYPTLAAPNVELASALTEVRANSVIDAGGTEQEVDAIVLGTGFHVADPPVGDRLRGRSGMLMSEVWDGRPRAYMGASVPDFPNLFLLLGPNTGLGHSSMIYMIEAQIEHVLAALTAMEARAAGTIEVDEDAYENWNAEIDSRMARTVWATGCPSFYIDASGRNAVLWPDWTWRFRRRAGRFDPAAYRLSAATPEAVAA
ncbi:MAG: NAD(P)/FAD-dependent oxidoreductase [Solirubrobacterales bacterium]|nr:NAD(P)/FAD-dependent oxidoreductase [Solirubrobacterales bacterium]